MSSSNRISLQEAQQRLQHRTDITVDWNTYTKIGERVQAQCNKCNHTWSPFYRNIEGVVDALSVVQID